MKNKSRSRQIAAKLAKSLMAFATRRPVDESTGLGARLVSILKGSTNPLDEWMKRELKGVNLAQNSVEFWVDFNFLLNPVPYQRKVGHGSAEIITKHYIEKETFDQFVDSFQKYFVMLFDGAKLADTVYETPLNARVRISITPGQFAGYSTERLAQLLLKPSGDIGPRFDRNVILEVRKSRKKDRGLSNLGDRRRHTVFLGTETERVQQNIDLERVFQGNPDDIEVSEARN